MQENITAPFEYKNKIEWCPQVEGFVTYALRLDNGDLYKGYTGNFRQRMLNHFNGQGGHTTKKNKPLFVYHHECFSTKKEAIDREKFFKTVGASWLKTLEIPVGFKPPAFE